MSNFFSFERFLLLESDQRVQYLKNAFKDKISDGILDQIIKSDPHRNNIYTQWIINQYLKKSIDVNDLHDVRKFLLSFDNIKLLLPAEKRDIMRIKLQPGVNFNDQTSVIDFYVMYKKVLAERGVDDTGNFIGGEILKKYSKNLFLVRVQNPDFCRAKAEDSGWCIRNSEEYVDKFINKQTGIFLMDNGVAEIACEYEPESLRIVDIQGRFNKMWDKRYDAAVIDLLKLLGPVKNIAGHRNTFWIVYKERPEFKNAVDHLSNVTIDINRKISLRKAEIPVIFTEDEVENLTPIDKLEFGYSLSEEEISNLSISLKIKYDIGLTPEERESLVGTLYGKVKAIVDNGMDMDDIKILITEDMFPEGETKWGFDKTDFGIEMSNKDFWENIYEMDEYDSYYLTQDFDIDCREEKDYIHSYFNSENDELLFEIFKKLGRTGITKKERTFEAGVERDPNQNDYYIDIEEGVIEKFYEEYKDMIKTDLDDICMVVGDKANGYAKKTQAEYVGKLLFGVKDSQNYRLDGVHNGSYNDAYVSGWISTWAQLKEYFEKYGNSDVKTFTELLERTPLINGYEALGSQHLDEALADYHFTNEVTTEDLKDINEDIKEDLEKILEFLQDPEGAPEDRQEVLSNAKEMSDILNSLGFENDKATKNNITIQIEERNPAMFKFKIRIFKANGKNEHGWVKADNLYKYFEKTLFEKRFFKSYDQFLKESKNLSK